MFTNQRNQNGLFFPGNHFHALYVKFSDRTESALLYSSATQEFLRISNDFAAEVRGCSTDYRRRTSPLYFHHLSERTRPGRLAALQYCTHKHSYTCAIICECTPGHKGLATVQEQTACYIRLETKASTCPHSHWHSRFRGTDIIEGKNKTLNITQKTVNNTNAHASTLLCFGLFLGSVSSISITLPFGFFSCSFSCTASFWKIKDTHKTQL